MNIVLEPKKSGQVLRLTALILLVGIIPFGTALMYNQGEDYEILFPIIILMVLVPELFIKVFLKACIFIYKGRQDYGKVLSRQSYRITIG